jgi:N-glycosylase/DNA lyase
MKSTTIYLCERIENAVRALCPIIEHQVITNIGRTWNEYSLRRELVACILGSQVRHEMATSALELIEQDGLFSDNWWNNTNDIFEIRIFNLLSGSSRNGNKWCYRFPKIRANQIAKLRDATKNKSISERIDDTSDSKHIRQQLVEDISGLGPKQASMFLRNIGKCYDLAILDTHVLRFMDMQQLLCLNHTNITTVPAYERTEGILINYAKSLGYPVGYLDWAIWATMRAARELGL